MTPIPRVCLLSLVGSCLLTAMLAAQGKPTFPQGGRASQAANVRVEIVQLRKLPGPAYEVRVRLTGWAGNRQPQVLLFVQEQKGRRFFLAADRDANGRPLFPTRSKLDPPVEATSEWTSKFSSPVGDAPVRVLAVACIPGARASLYPEKEADAFKYLPFGEAATEEQLFRILAEFDWRPVGYTDLKVDSSVF
ncbi:MAG TPA: hypothetical protein VIX63_03640 [Vicinamibacterales bacterium]